MDQQQYNNSGQQPQPKRQVPQSELDYNFQLTNPVYGNPQVSDGLQSQLKKIVTLKDAQGNVIYNEKTGEPYLMDVSSLWDLLAFYTRDLRLGNLSVWDNEIGYCRYYLDLAGDYLQEGMIECFLICFKRSATVTETSQSKGGFLRRIINTIRSENISGNLEPPKKSLFGGKKKDDFGG
jgi:hypothetical protein